MTFVDTNVLLDIVTNDPVWFDWSAAQLRAAIARGPLLINDIVYAELSVRFQTLEALDDAVRDLGVTRTPMPSGALFLAAKAFKMYRSAGGVRTGVLPDFFIGAQAALAGVALITRDDARLRTYFPTLGLIVP